MRWTRRTDRETLNFGSRAEAFAFMLREQLERGRDAMEAAEKANEFADIFAKNLGLADRTEPPKEGLDKYLQHMDRVVSYCEEHPKAVDMVTGVATFLVGAFFGKRAEERETEREVMSPQEPIDFDKLE